MDKSTMVIIAILLIGIAILALRKRGDGPDIVGPLNRPDPFAIGEANTKAVEENTAAVRALITKLEQIYPSPPVDPTKFSSR